MRRIAVLAAAALVAIGVAASSAEPAERPPRIPRDPGPVISLTFDDGTEDHVLAARLLEERGFRGTFYVNSSLLGRAGRLTKDHLARLADAGHEIGGHTLDHRRLPELDEEDQRRQICEDRRVLAARGLDVRSFAYPYGARDATSMRLVEECGYRSARSVGGVGSTQCRGCSLTEPLPLVNRFEIRSATTGLGGKPITRAKVKDLKTFVIRAKRNGKGLVPIVFHTIRDDGSKYSITREAMEEFLDWLKDKRDSGLISVRTMGYATR